MAQHYRAEPGLITDPRYQRRDDNPAYVRRHGDAPWAASARRADDLVHAIEVAVSAMEHATSVAEWRAASETVWFLRSRSERVAA